ncbi:MAG: hypothetical protein ACLUOI_20220 [Eisenbergiella sp.]
MEEMDEYGSAHIVMNLETGQTMKVSDGERVKALAFINEDFVYGLARDTDIVTDAAGNVTFAMYRICIQNINGEIVKDYQRDGIYVTAVTENNGLLELDRVNRTESGYAAISADHIMNNIQENENTVSIRLSVSDRKGTQVILDFQAVDHESLEPTTVPDSGRAGNVGAVRTGGRAVLRLWKRTPAADLYRRQRGHPDGGRAGGRSSEQPSAVCMGAGQYRELCDAGYGADSVRNSRGANR